MRPERIAASCELGLPVEKMRSPNQQAADFSLERAQV